MQIIELEKIEEYRAPLVELLCDCVSDGASIGFIAPLSKAEADEYWQGVAHDLSGHSKILFLAKENDRVFGTVQLSLCQKKNGRHRAEIEK